MKSIYLSKKEVARKLNISSSTVTRWAKEIPNYSKTNSARTKYSCVG